MDTNSVLQESVIMFGILVGAAGTIALAIRFLTGRSVILKVGALTLTAVVLDVELGFILAKIGLTPINILIMYGIGITATIGLLYGMFRVVILPLQALIAAGQRIAQGDLSEPVNYESEDEIGQLAAILTDITAYQREIAQVAERIAAGDLLADVSPQSANDVLGNSFQQMINDLRNLIKQVATSANAVGTASGQLSDIADQAAQATQQVTASIQQVATGTAQQTRSVSQAITVVGQVTQAIKGVARGAQEQSTATSQSAGSTNLIAAATVEVATKARASAKAAAQAAQAAREGTVTVEKTVAGMQSIKEKVTLSAHRVREMDQRSDQIGAIVETIESIASQTNLLALNAAIEAARAGEHGRGFSVVADEVRKLAESSAEATKEIADLIKGIRRTISEAVQVMDEGVAEVEAGATRADETGQALDTILSAAESVDQQIDEIVAAAETMNMAATDLVESVNVVSAVVEENTAATEEMTAGAGEVSEAMENIAHISEMNGAATEEVTAVTEEMSAQVEQVTASAQSLSGMAQELLTMMAQFKLPVAQEV